METVLAEADGGEERARGGLVIDVPLGTTRGFVVLDRVLCDRTCGGLRVLPDVTVDEIRGQARFMTNKFAFFGIACGGAKAGLVEVPGWGPEDRAEALEAFGRALRPIMQRRLYIVAEDMGCRREDAWRLSYGAGLVPSPVPAANGSGRTSGTYAGVTAAVAGAVALEHAGRRVAGATFAVEGFGRVGRSAALALAARGARLRAASTVHGAIAAEHIDPRRLGDFLDAHGEAAITRFPGARPIPRAALFSEDVDLLLPCARPAAIHAGNVDELRCRAIAPGGNCAVAEGLEDALHARGIVSVPAFVANAGGVVAGHLSALAPRAATRDWLFTEWFAGLVRRLLRAAAARGVPPETVAAECVARNLDRLASLRRPPAGESLLRRIGRCRLRRLVPSVGERAVVRAALGPAI